MAMSVKRVLTAAVLAVACTACSADGPAAGDTDRGVSNSSEVGLPVERLLDGSPVDVEALSHDKPVALWFWAPG
jgi:hypothetical protein